MKVGPTERIGLLSDVVPAVAAAVLAAAGADEGAASGGGAAVVVPFLPGAGVDLAIGCDIFLALSSVTMISPCCAAAALSSMLFRASDHV